MAGHDVEVPVGISVAGVLSHGTFIVGPEDHLVLNLGAAATRTHVEDARLTIAAWRPELAGRVMVIGAEGMAVVRGEPTPDEQLAYRADLEELARWVRARQAEQHPATEGGIALASFARQIEHLAAGEPLDA